jgi:hypothetical protein
MKSHLDQVVTMNLALRRNTYHLVVVGGLSSSSSSPASWSPIQPFILKSRDHGKSQSQQSSHATRDGKTLSIK